MSWWSLVCWLSLWVCMANAGGPVIQTASGPIEGITRDGVDIFWGVPFAASPVGPLRFRAPQPAQPWTELRDCTKDAPKCPQWHIFGNYFTGQEDCLTLDVYVPSNRTNATLPVMVFIYGGGFVVGGSFQNGHYDGTKLAQRGVVVVCIQYRINVLGFLALEELRAEVSDGGTGNYGLQDQRLALQWVQHNIGFFSGNPSKVTIFGESAGGVSVCAHLVSPASVGLFHAAIVESGICDTTLFFAPVEGAMSFGANFSRHVGCTTPGPERLECLRSLPLKDVLAYMLIPNITLPAPAPQDWMGLEAWTPLMIPAIAFVPAVDGAESGLMDFPVAMVRAGNFTRVPTIMGTNHDEGSVFAPFSSLVAGHLPPLTQAKAEDVIRHLWAQDIVKEVQQMYPPASYKSPTARIAAIMRAFMFTCPTRRFARALSAGGAVTWLYNFNYTLRWIDTKIFGDYHTSELDFVFGTHSPMGLHKFNEDDQKIADYFQGFWTSLAEVGAPAAAAVWPPYLAATDLNLALDIPLAVETGLLKHECDFWDRVPDIALPPHFVGSALA